MMRWVFPPTAPGRPRQRMPSSGWADAHPEGDDRRQGQVEIVVGSSIVAAQRPVPPPARSRIAASAAASPVRRADTTPAQQGEQTALDARLSEMNKSIIPTTTTTACTRSKMAPSADPARPGTTAPRRTSATSGVPDRGARRSRRIRRGPRGFRPGTSANWRASARRSSAARPQVLVQMIGELDDDPDRRRGGFHLLQARISIKVLHPIAASRCPTRSSIDSASMPGWRDFLLLPFVMLSTHGAEPDLRATDCSAGHQPGADGGLGQPSLQKPQLLIAAVVSTPR